MTHCNKAGYTSQVWSTRLSAREGASLRGAFRSGRDAKAKSRMTPYLTSAPVRATLCWQAVATLLLAFGAGLWHGWSGAVSVVCGGLIIVLAGLAYAGVISVSNSPSVATTLRTMVLAEAAKIAMIVLTIWAVVTQYKDLDGASFFAAFVVAVLLNRVAFWNHR